MCDPAENRIEAGEGASARHVRACVRIAKHRFESVATAPLRVVDDVSAVKTGVNIGGNEPRLMAHCLLCGFDQQVEGALKSMIEAEPLPPLNAVEVVGRFLGSIRGYAVPRFVRDDYLASYEGDRLTRSAALVRAYPKDLAVLAPRLASIEIPVAIVVGRNDPYGLARDAALLRDRLPAQECGGSL